MVVVDGSTDKTEEIVRGENVSIIINHKNLGLTKSIKNGFQYALKNGYDAIVKLDADEQMNSNSYKKMMDQYQASKDDIIYATNNSDTPWMIKKDIWIYTSLFNLASKQKNVDIISEYRLFSRKAMKTYLESKLR
ncbi:glycosyltransferase, partial [Candidatus Pacearchaeota archaeon]|nr:glycosyltransferase [Candidatus Pacearchaeota archaeon]